MTSLRWFLIALFLIVGMAKVTSFPPAVAFFAAVGAGQWLRYAVGSSEVLGAVLLAHDSTALAGALLLGFMMVGAAVTEVMILNRVPVSSGLTLIAVMILLRALR
jgi:uncharacterized membrane protein YphA (DoxX/SURF4 family)